MFIAVLFIGINNCSTVQPVVAIERTVVYRERAAGMYSAIPYAMAQVRLISFQTSIQQVTLPILLSQVYATFNLFNAQVEEENVMKLIKLCHKNQSSSQNIQSSLPCYTKLVNLLNSFFI